MVHKIALDYTNKTDFNKNAKGAYGAAKKYGWFDEVTSHMSSPIIKWTKEMIASEAKKYKTKEGFRKGSPVAYQTARKLGILNDVTNHMVPYERQSKYTEDEIRKRAKQFNTPTEFFKNDLAAYTAAQRFNILDDVMSHMLKKRDLTPDLIRSIAKKYKTRREFELGDTGAYQKAHKLGIFDDVTSHMEKQYNDWTYDDVKKIADKYDNLKKFGEEQPKALGTIYRNKWYELTNHMERGFKWWSDADIFDSALKFNSRSEWQKSEGSAYNAARERGIFDDATKHMVFLGNMYRRAVYVWEFPNNSVYVGLTLNTERRKKEHSDIEGKSEVSKYIKKTGLTPLFKLISDDYIDASDAQNLEDCTIQDYKIKGWSILNKSKAGGLGGCKRRDNKDIVAKEALKYSSKVEWLNNSPKTYNTAYRNGWMSELTTHMIKGRIEWTVEKVLDEMKKYKTMAEFRAKSPKAYQNLRYRKLYSIAKDYYNNV